MGIIRTCFFDSSALIKRYIKTEKGYNKAQDIFSFGAIIFTSCIAIGEVLNILKNRLKGDESKESIYCFEADIRGHIVEILELKRDNLDWNILKVREFEKNME